MKRCLTTALLAILALMAPALALAGDAAQTQPSDRLTVTYYFLPG